MAEVEYVGASRIYPGNPVPAVNELDLEIADGPGPLLGGDIDGLKAESVAQAIVGVDKGWVFWIGPDGNDGYTLAGREFDATTLRLNPTLRRPRR